MKLKLSKLLFLISVLFVFSCTKSPEEIESDYIKTQINSLITPSNTKWVVVMPGLGCKGCIQEGELFMSQNAANDDILFVLTKVESLKLLQQKTGVNINDHKNFQIDSDNRFEVPTDNGIYPLIVKIVDQKMVSYQFQSPKNSMAFATLSDELKSK